MVGPQIAMDLEHRLYPFRLVYDGHLSEFGSILAASSGHPQFQYPPRRLDSHYHDGNSHRDLSMGQYLGFD